MSQAEQGSESLTSRLTRFSRALGVMAATLAVVVPNAHALRPSPEESARLANVKTGKVATVLADKIHDHKTSQEVILGTPEDKQLVHVQAVFEGSPSQLPGIESEYSFDAYIRVGDDQKLHAGNVQNVYLAAGKTTGGDYIIQYALVKDDQTWDVSADYRTGDHSISRRGVTLDDNRYHLISHGLSEDLLSLEEINTMAKEMNRLFERGVNLEPIAIAEPAYSE